MSNTGFVKTAMTRTRRGAQYVLLFGLFSISSQVWAAPFDVGRYISTGPGPVNTWWVETPGHGLILIDAQRDLSQARAAVEKIRATGLPVKAILITHPHPDHVSGLIIFKAAFPDAHVYMQAETRDEITANKAGFLSTSRPDVPDHYVGPDNVLNKDDSPNLDGANVLVSQLGQGESQGMTTYLFTSAKMLFSGDVATPGVLPFLAEGRTRKWLQQLHQLRRKCSTDTRIFPGHGDSGLATSMIDQQALYVEAYRRLVAEKLTQSPDATSGSQSALAGQVAQEMNDRFPTSVTASNLPLARDNEMNFSAVARELSQEK